MAYVVEIPIEDGGRLLVQAAEEDLPGGLELAALRPGEVVTQARQTLEQALDQLKPAIQAVRRQLDEMTPDEVSLEFGVLLGAEAGAVVVKGKTEVHFNVTLTWKQPEGRV